jgi:hypothetical protein
LYYYLATIQEDGFLKMAPSKDPENPYKVNINRAIVTTTAEADLAKAKVEILAKQSDAVKALAVAAGDKDRAASQGLLSTANIAVTAGTGIASAGGFSQNLAVAGVMLSAGSAIAVGGIAVSAVAAKRVSDAAAKDYEGAEQAAVIKRQMLNSQMQSEELNFKAKLLSGNAQFAFKSSKSYVFVDAPERPPLGSTAIPKDATDNLQQVTDLLGVASTVMLDTTEGFEKLLAMMQDSIYLMSSYFVVTPFIKKKFVDKMNNLFDAYDALYGEDINPRVMNNMINLIFSAINNGYLVNAQTNGETREVWYTWVNKLAHTMLTQTKAIKLNACYGEYIWLPFDVSTADDITLTFDAEGLHDVLVGFAQEPGRLRNTNTEIYEMCIGGWNNTKTAIRLKSLGDSVASFDKTTNPTAMLNAYKKQTYSVVLKGGELSLFASDKKALSWKDPYPLKGIKWVGISTWDVPISFSNIMITSGNQAATNLDTTKSQSALLAQASKNIGKPVAALEPGAGLINDDEIDPNLSDEELEALIAQAEAEEAAGDAPVAKQVTTTTQKPTDARIDALRAKVNDDSKPAAPIKVGKRKAPSVKTKAAQARLKQLRVKAKEARMKKRARRKAAKLARLKAKEAVQKTALPAPQTQPAAVVTTPTTPAAQPVAIAAMPAPQAQAAPPVAVVKKTMPAGTAIPAADASYELDDMNTTDDADYDETPADADDGMVENDGMVEDDADMENDADAQEITA